MTPEQAMLLDKAADSLRAVALLATEDLYDFATSRAYYAMFYAAQALLLEDGLSFSSHAAVIAAFGRHFAKTGRVPVEYHRFLIQAHDSRNVGDYDIGPGISREECDRHAQRAAAFVETARHIIDPPSPG